MRFLYSLIGVLSIILLFCTGSFSQPTFPYNGILDQREGLYAFTGATIVQAYDKKLEEATLLIHKGRIIDAGNKVRIPEGAVVVDLSGKYLYPSFIDLYSDYGMPEVKRKRNSSRGPQMLSDKKGAYGWNEALRPEFRAAEYFQVESKAAAEWRKLGFGAVLSHRMDGISRGSSVLVSLADKPAQEVVLRKKVAHHLSFSKGSSSQDYPRSLMGCIALLRQTWYDAEWYDQGGRKEEQNLSLEAWNVLRSIPHVFTVGNKLEVLRAARIGKEFGLSFLFKGAGDEYQRINAISQLNAAFILPLNFPAPYDVSDPYDAELVDLADLKHWEMAPGNASQLHKADVKIAFTVHDLKKKGKWMDQLRKVIEAGLPENEALRALTLTPARLMGMGDQLGSLHVGKLANFLITSGPIFDKKTIIYHNWVQGEPYVLKALPVHDLAGRYRLQVGADTFSLQVSGEPDKYRMKILKKDTTEIKVKARVEQNLITLSFAPEEGEGQVLLSGALVSADRWRGKGTDALGQWINWTAQALEPDSPESSPSDDPGESSPRPGQAAASTIYPFSAYGRYESPQPRTYLFKNATVWTNEQEGVQENTDVLVRDGKIAAVGRNLSDASATLVHAEGKHLTCGIIDEHSHIGISRGVNEGTQASSAEVRIGDVVDSENINFYRQLAGGVTTAQLLHGSANPIGGQSALVKFRWGYLPEEMKIKDAPGFIKFALGENVKQSNWGDSNRTRYPQTRMGVEQIFEEYFTRAREYGEKKRSAAPYRVNLELEALLEILEGKRFITCHSYQQGEINMLMKVAERHGFRVNTFTHILEGYKVADKMAAHGAAGSSFSDWWAYKYEVIDAIPYNGALMHEQGVLTGFNSDDAEMARRLNQEAAKAVKYGGLPEEEAWKFVTLNPAKMLHLDDRMGSIKVGKDADLVIWSDNPLSIYARAEQTYIDGIRFYDLEEDRQMRKEIRQERNRLIQAMLKAKEGGAKTRPAQGRQEKHYHCDDIQDEGSSDLRSEK